MISKRLVVLGVGCGLLLGACSRQDSDAPPPGPTVAGQMHQNLARVTEIRDAVIAADLEALREPARWLAENEPAAGLPEGWEPYMSTLQEFAGATAGAGDIYQAAGGAASMARICGTCHDEFEVNVSFAYPPPPADEDTVVARMLRHTWAAERMWEGLVASSDMAWNWGVDLLTEAPMKTEEVAPGSALADQIGPLARRVHRLGVDGIEAEEWDARAQIYGQFVATCAACHELLGAGPRRRAVTD